MHVNVEHSWQYSCVHAACVNANKNCSPNTNTSNKNSNPLEADERTQISSIAIATRARLPDRAGQSMPSLSHYPRETKAPRWPEDGLGGGPAPPGGGSPTRPQRQPRSRGVKTAPQPWFFLGGRSTGSWKPAQAQSHSADRATSGRLGPGDCGLAQEPLRDLLDQTAEQDA